MNAIPTAKIVHVHKNLLTGVKVMCCFAGLDRRFRSIFLCYVVVVVVCFAAEIDFKLSVNSMDLS